MKTRTLIVITTILGIVLSILVSLRHEVYVSPEVIGRFTLGRQCIQNDLEIWLTTVDGNSTRIYISEKKEFSCIALKKRRWSFPGDRVEISRLKIFYGGVIRETVEFALMGGDLSTKNPPAIFLIHIAIRKLGPDVLVEVDSSSIDGSYRKTLSKDDWERTVAEFLK